MVSAETKKKCSCGMKSIYLGGFVEFKNGVLKNEVFEFLRLEKISFVYAGMKLQEHACNDFLQRYEEMRSSANANVNAHTQGQRKSPTR